MPVPDIFKSRLSIPVIAAPMFLVSGPGLVSACCLGGVAGTFPALNARTEVQFNAWLTEISGNLAAATEPVAPYGVNLVLHSSNPRRDGDLALIVRHKVPFVITSLGNPREVVEAVHGYGGVVFSDVIHAKHARKAIDVGVDGIIAVAAGAGGHAGIQSPFALIRQIREFWDGPLVLGGAISDGAAIRATEVLGADLAYVGTRFIATVESLAVDAYKQMLVNSSADDIVYTDSITGTHANMLKTSMDSARAARDGTHHNEPKAWRDVWSAGHGVSLIHDIPTTAELISRMGEEYRRAATLPTSPSLRIGEMSNDAVDLRGVA